MGCCQHRGRPADVVVAVGVYAVIGVGAARGVVILAPVDLVGGGVEPAIEVFDGDDVDFTVIEEPCEVGVSAVARDQVLYPLHGKLRGGDFAGVVGCDEVEPGLRSWDGRVGELDAPDVKTIAGVRSRALAGVSFTPGVADVGEGGEVREARDNGVEVGKHGWVVAVADVPVGRGGGDVAHDAHEDALRASESVLVRRQRHIRNVAEVAWHVRFIAVSGRS